MFYAENGFGGMANEKAVALLRSHGGHD